MTRFEMEKMMRDVLKKEHTPEEWRKLYAELGNEAIDFYLVEEQMEEIIVAKYGEEELMNICEKATNMFLAMKEAQAGYNKEDIDQDIDPEVQAFLNEYFGDDEPELD